MILLCYGTRPEWLKIAPIAKELERRSLHHAVLFTRQHDDLIDDHNHDYRLQEYTHATNRLDQIIRECMDKLSTIPRISCVVIQGDTASAFAMALSAYNHGLPVVHIEAGMRTYDNVNPYPEEGYRRMISAITDIHFCPTEDEKRNIQEEKLLGKTHVVGNTVLDNLFMMRNEVVNSNNVVITMHRRENQLKWKEWNDVFQKLIDTRPNENFQYVMHPSMWHTDRLSMIGDNFSFLEPLPHEHLMMCVMKCKYLVTDSGGLQEESSFFGKKAYVCREETERPQGLATGHSHLCTPENLISKIENTLDDPFEPRCPYGDGTSSRKIVDILVKELDL